MVATLHVVVSGIAAFVEEFLEEESVQEEDDVVEEFLPLFWANNLLPERRKVVRIEGYAEKVVPNYNLSEFRSHFRLSADTFEQLVTENFFAGTWLPTVAILFVVLKKAARRGRSDVIILD